MIEDPHRRMKVVSLKVGYKSATVEEFIERHAADVSRRGIFLKTTRPLPVGTVLKFEVHLASGKSVLAGVGRVAWKREGESANGVQPAGMGVRFVEVDAQSRKLLDKLVAARPDAGLSYENSAEVISDASASDAKPAPDGPGTKASTPAPGQKFGRSTLMGMGNLVPPRVPSPSRAGASSVPPPPRRPSTLMGMGNVVPPRVPPPRPGVSSAPPPPPEPMFPESVAEAEFQPEEPTLVTRMEDVVRAHVQTQAKPAPPQARRREESLFPKVEAPAPTQEPTLMKQVSVLLEEALRETGGSMEDLANPLFSGLPAKGEALDSQLSEAETEVFEAAAPLPVPADVPTAPRGVKAPAEPVAVQPTSVPPSSLAPSRVERPARRKSNAVRAGAVLGGLSVIALALLAYRHWEIPGMPATRTAAPVSASASITQPQTPPVTAPPPSAAPAPSEVASLAAPSASSAPDPAGSSTTTTGAAPPAVTSTITSSVDSAAPAGGLRKKPAALPPKTGGALPKPGWLLKPSKVDNPY